MNSTLSAPRTLQTPPRAEPARPDPARARPSALTEAIINGTGRLPDCSAAETARLAGLRDAMQAELPADAQELPQALLSLLQG